MEDRPADLQRLILQSIWEEVWDSIEHDLDAEYGEQSIVSSSDDPDPEERTTLDEFLKAFDLVHDQFEWKLSPVNSPMAERRSKPRLVLRATPKRAPNMIVFDPVVAVCYALTGQLHHWPKAGAALGLELSDSAALVAASNDYTFSGPKGQRKPEAQLIAIRKRLLRRVGKHMAGRTPVGD